MLLADGYTTEEVAQQVGVSVRAVYKWKHAPEFAEEVDRLTLMTDIASQAERIKIAKKRVRQILAGLKPEHKPDNLLDWLKYAQSEIDGVKLDLTKLAAIFDDAEPVADSGQDRTGPTPTGQNG